MRRGVLCPPSERLAGDKPGTCCCWQHGKTWGHPLCVLRSSVYKNTYIYGAIDIASRHSIAQQGMTAQTELLVSLPSPCHKSLTVAGEQRAVSALCWHCQNLLFLQFCQKTLGLKFPFQPSRWLLGWFDSSFAAGQHRRAPCHRTLARGCPSCEAGMLWHVTL